MRSGLIDMVAGFFSLLFAGAFYVQIGELEGVGRQYPQWIVGFITLGSAVLLVHGLIKIRGRETDEDKEPVAYNRVGVIMLATVLYVIFVTVFGFYTASVVFLFVTAMLLNDMGGGFKKNVLTACILTAVMCLAVRIGFTVLLYVPTPEGLFF